MEDKKLQFDRTKHVIYTPKAKAVIQGLLKRDYPTAESEELWEKIQLQYAAYLEDEPALGGLKLSAGVYDGILVFAYYVTVPKSPLYRTYSRRSSPYSWAALKFWASSLI